jgi:hypothetical protein
MNSSFNTSNIQASAVACNDSESLEHLISESCSLISDLITVIYLCADNKISIA